MEMDLQMVISQRPRLYPTLFQKLMAFLEFKADLHNLMAQAAIFGI